MLLDFEVITPAFPFICTEGLRGRIRDLYIFVIFFSFLLNVPIYWEIFAHIFVLNNQLISEQILIQVDYHTKLEMSCMLSNNKLVLSFF